VPTATSALPFLLDSWELALRAERKSPQTVKSYTDGIRRFLRWCEEAGRMPAIDRTRDWPPAGHESVRIARRRGYGTGTPAEQVAEEAAERGDERLILSS
jgi:hypothetical protein